MVKWFVTLIYFRSDGVNLIKGLNPTAVNYLNREQTLTVKLSKIWQ
jgi:hypothetical protein